MATIDVFEKKKVRKDCSTCLYGRGFGCGNANRSRDWMKYSFFGGCPSYWLDQHRFDPVDGKRW